MSRDHDHGHDAIQAAPEVGRLLRVIVGAMVAVTIIGLVVWWPSGGAGLPESFEGQGDRANATVTRQELVECAGAEFGVVGECVEVVFDVTSGPRAGSSGSFELYPETQAVTSSFEVGADIVVIEYELGDTGEFAYTFADYQRTRPMLMLAALFVASVIALGRWQGVRALVGLVVSGVVLFGFIFPALLDGQPPLAVSLVGASVIALAALYLAHGFNDTTTVALIGTMAALVLTGVLGAVFSAAARITGQASEDQIYLLVSSEGIDLRGLVLAGIILGSLGVLDDVTVTQVSAVARLREANPDYTVRDLYRTGVHIGRDHIASTVNTLVLAYAGAALPLLLFYTNVGIPLSQSVTSEIIAVEIVRTLVGSIGLISAVPLTTVAAAVVVTGTGLPGVSSRGTTPRRPRPARSEVAVTPADWDEFTPDEDSF